MIHTGILAAACIALTGPNITARDLAKAIPSFAAADPSAVAGSAPAPGIPRTLRPAEIGQLQERLHVTGPLPAEDVCFEKPVTPLSESAVLAAMRTVLGKNASIEIVELSRLPAPEGDMVFPRENLGAPPVALWPGYVRYDGDKRFPVWARVKVRMPLVRVVAAEDLKAGRPIEAAQVKAESVEDFPVRRSAPETVEAVVGWIPRRALAAGSSLWSDSLDPPQTILKGDRIRVTVQSGLARFRFDTEASASGRCGDYISVVNPASGKAFRARIEAPGLVTVDVPPSH